MKTKRTLTIDWEKPNLKEEVGEYLENDFTRNFFKRKYKLELVNEREVYNFLSYGSSKIIDRVTMLRAVCKNMTITEKDFDSELKDKDYRKSYDSMHKELLEDGKIRLPSPILIKFPTLYYGFAGNRRTNLAFNLNMDVCFWIVDYNSYINHLKIKKAA